jgi:hypothetical protein
MRSWLRDRRPAALSAQVREAEDRFAVTALELGADLRPLAAQLRERLRRSEGAGRARFAHVSFECTHLGQRNAQTAWSLGPEDKARVLVRFLVELHLRRAELRSWAAELDRDDAELVRRQLQAFFCPLLVKAVARTSDDLRTASGRARAEARLAEVEHMADRFGIDLGAGPRTTLRDVRKGASQPAALAEALKLIEPSLRRQQKEAEARARELLGRALPADWQARRDLRDLLSQELHVRARAAN